MEKQKAIKAAEEFCKNNNIDIDKLKGQWVQFFDGKVIFAKAESITNNGLVDDLKSKCIPTLIVDEKYKVSINPAGEKYLR